MVSANHASSKSALDVNFDTFRRFKCREEKLLRHFFSIFIQEQHEDLINQIKLALIAHGFDFSAWFCDGLPFIVASNGTW